MTNSEDQEKGNQPSAEIEWRGFRFHKTADTSGVHPHFGLVGYRYSRWIVWSFTSKPDHWTAGWQEDEVRVTASSTTAQLALDLCLESVMDMLDAQAVKVDALLDQIKALTKVHNIATREIYEIVQRQRNQTQYGRVYSSESIVVEVPSTIFSDDQTVKRAREMLEQEGKRDPKERFEKMVEDGLINEEGEVVVGKDSE